MKCCLCDSYHESELYLHTHILEFAVCYCCEDDMNEELRTAFNSFARNLIGMLRKAEKESEVKKFSLILFE